MTFARLFSLPNRPRNPTLNQFISLLEPMNDETLAGLIVQSESVTRRFFGRTMRLFAPLYLSSECINSCKYCGFSRDNPILRVTLSVDQAEVEAKYLVQQGFRNVLLVSGEHPKFVSNGYLLDVVRRLVRFVPSVSIEVAPMETNDYRPLVAAGIEGLIVYQETYDRTAYAEVHTAGPKKDFEWRLETPERAYAAGFRRIGIAPLFGLADWRFEAVALAEHVDYLLRKCWRSQLTVSLPRLRPAAGGFHPQHSLSDRDMIQLLCALRVTFPQVGIVLSTRESTKFRDFLMPIGVTMMSAGSRTEPGGYTGQGKDSLHLTVKGRVTPSACANSKAEGQFEVEDSRSPEEVAAAIRATDLEPVWKDWDSAILSV
ncbi:MAG TPA: 2-iminoacetate synthase ThiH [Chthoniobacterales bacterium]|nr:2-iminoacetate synthase ThiH [Chthoniobacterales bacterium]